MRPLGLLGGMTYHATLLYYSQINAHVASCLPGGNHSAKLLLHSFDFAETSELIAAGRWDEIARLLAAAAKNLVAGGARGVLMCVNIMHKVAEEVEKELGDGVEFLHIADFTGKEIVRKGVKVVGLLGTRPVCEEDFVKGRLREKFGLEVLVPEERYRVAMHETIFRDLGKGLVTEETRRLFAEIVEDLVSKGAEGIVLACTDLQFVLKQEDVKVPLFDTVELHARGAAEWSLKDG